MRLAGIVGLKSDGKRKGLSVGLANEVIKEFKKKQFEGFSKVIYFEDSGRKITKKGSPAKKPATAKVK